MRYNGVDIVLLPDGFKGDYPVPGEDSVSFATDSINIVLDAETAINTPEGFAKWEQITIAREMVQDYNGDKVYKPADGLRTMLNHGENKPVTDTHPPKQIVTSNSQIKGYIDNLVFTDDSELCADVTVSNQKLIDAIKSGKQREISIGFRAKTINAHGVFNDVEYAKIQTDMLLDHVAIVENGRCSLLDGCGFKNPISVIKQDSVQTNISNDAKKAIDLANSLIADQRVGFIAEISAINDTLDRNTLDAMSIDELRRLKTAITPSNNSIQMKSVADSKSGIDAAYAKVGGQ